MTSRSGDVRVCGKLAGRATGRLCERCDGKCVVCESFVNQRAPARICDECKGPGETTRCCLCGNRAVADAYYCSECCLFEKDRDGCPTIINVAVSRRDLHFDTKKRQR